MKREKRIIFFGDFAPKYLDGISLSSTINLRYLEQYFHIDRIEENNDFNSLQKFKFNKIVNILKKINLIIASVRKKDSSIFYMTYSLSLFGAIKTLSILLVVKMFSQVQIILHIHRGDFFTRFINWKTKIISKIIFSLSYKVIVLSASQKKEFTDYFCLDNVTFLTNTIDEKYIERNFLKTTNQPNFLFVSNYLNDKGIIDLLEVATLVCKNGVNLETYGNFSDKELKKKILGYQSDFIKINNSIEDGAKFKKINNAECLILPSWVEGQPLILLEAMACGTPIIATKVGLIEEMLGKEYEFLYEAKDRKQLKNKMNYFLDLDLNDKTKISTYLMKHYNKYFSNEKHFSKLVEIFLN